MRKDLKIGMAIGAVLLAVVIVYFAMPKPETTELAAGGGDGGADVSEQATDGASEDATGGEPDAGQPDQGESPDTGDSSEPGATAPPVVAGRGGSSDPFAPGAEGATPEEAAEEVASAGGGDTNWTKLLATGRAEIVTTETPAAANRGSAGGGATLTGQAPPDTDATSVPPVTAGGSVAGGDTTGAAPVERDQTRPNATFPGSSDTAASRIPSGSNAAGAGRTHVMRKDETYTSIAKMLYDDGRHYLAIQEANPDLDPTRIRPGTVINLPDPATINAKSTGDDDSTTVAGAGAGNGAATAEARRPLDPKTEYEVKANDSLHKIATRVYGTSTMWEKIYELNQEAIGSDPAKLKLGTVLKLPPNPAADSGSAADTTDASSESASR